MAHELFGKRFVAARNKPAWHGIITEIPTDREVSVGEAVKLGGLDYRYADAPVGFTTPDGEFVSSEKKAVLRSPTTDDPIWRELGIVGRNYAYLQNAELAEGLDAVAKTAGWQFETLGALQRGGTVFMSLRMGSDDIAGDEVQNHLIVSDGKATGRALQVSVAKIRVVCMNTLLASDQAATTSIKIAHGAGVAGDYAFWTRYIADFHRARSRTTEELRAMAATKIEDDQARAVIAAAFPNPIPNAKARQAQVVSDTVELDAAFRAEALDRLAPGVQTHEYWVEFTGRQRDAAWELYERFNAGDEAGGKMPTVTVKKLSRTAYAALQAATELVDWGGRPQNGAYAILGQGAKAKQRAWGAALSLTGAPMP